MALVSSSTRRAARRSRGSHARRPVALSPCRPVALSPCRPVALSPCRPVSPSPGTTLPATNSPKDVARLPPPLRYPPLARPHERNARVSQLGNSAHSASRQISARGSCDGDKEPLVISSDRQSTRRAQRYLSPSSRARARRQQTRPLIERVDATRLASQRSRESTRRVGHEAVPAHRIAFTNGFAFPIANSTSHRLHLPGRPEDSDSETASRELIEIHRLRHAFTTRMYSYSA